VQRQVMRLLANAERYEPDPVVRRATRVALRQVIDYGLSAVLFQALRLDPRPEGGLRARLELPLSEPPDGRGGGAGGSGGASGG
ncbi:MAG: hypothetical protein AAFZ09_12515, partial [Pseudomonadota bacterium]